MKVKNCVYPLIIVLLTFLSSCKKDDTVSNPPPTINVPVVTTSMPDSVTLTTFICGGIITSDGGAEVTSRGICWSTSQNPSMTDNKTESGSGTGVFTIEITGLTAHTTYYARAFATNDSGTGYGTTVALTTTPGTVTDIDGNVYNTVTIGGQVWMCQDLKATHFRNGDSIPNVKDSNAWSSLKTSGYCDYNNDPNNSTVYGRLYNWYAAGDNRNIAPFGCHVPSDAEWETLCSYLGTATNGGTQENLGGKLKETGTSHWKAPNSGATNSSGFTALPSGGRDDRGTFSTLGTWVSYWTSTPFDADSSWRYIVGYNWNGVGRAHDFSDTYGFSVRCVKD